MINTFKVVVSGFVKNENGQLLVVRRSDNEATFAGRLAIPGGSVESDGTDGFETDIIEKNLIREIAKETGVNVKVLDWLESSAVVIDGQAKLYLFFSCELIDDGRNLQTSDETPEVFWANADEIDPEACTPPLQKFIQAL